VQWKSAPLVLAVLAGLLTFGCGGDQAAPPDGPPPDDTIPYQNLSRYGFFSDPVAQTPAPGVLPYEVVSVLFADGAGKLRFLVVPPGGQIHFDPSGRWTFPDGTTIIKTFYFDRDLRDPQAGWRLLETRLLMLRGGTWSAYTYIWDDAQTQATRWVAGRTLHVTQVGTDGQPLTFDYRVPSTDQCKTCHAQDTVAVPLGPRTRQLNRTHDYGQGPVNQLDAFAQMGLFDSAIPAPSTLDKLSDPAGTDALDRRARSYLDANCAHCHNAAGTASNTGLKLNWETTTPVDLGVCRRPVAAGHGSGNLLFDVVPGQPDQSIVVYRMRSTDPSIKMPQLPTLTSDGFGTQLVSDWIAALPAMTCQ